MADINITITIPDAWVSRVQDAITGQAEKRISTQFESANLSYQYTAKGGAETWIEFAGRVFKEHLKQQIKLYELSEDIARYDSEINSIDLPSEDVPDEILSNSK